MNKITPAFCSNLLPQESFAELMPALLSLAQEVRQRCGLARLGVDLRLGSQAIEQAGDKDCCLRWRDRYAAAGIVITSINAFPLRPFQAPVVKDQAYSPDWGTAERLSATLACIAIADALSDPQQNTCSVSTLPGSYRPWGQGMASPQQVAQAWGHWAAQAWQHHQQGGRRVCLAIEPEPCCLLGSGGECLAFWLQYRDLCVDAAAAQLASHSAGAEAVAQHLALCWDTCHASILYEDQPAILQALADQGLAPIKVQFSAAPACRLPLHASAVQALLDLDEPRFCHQVGLLRQGACQLLPDLPALRPLAEGWTQADRSSIEGLRCHFHIPVGSEPQHPGLYSSIAESRQGLQAARALSAQHVSVETYTWSLCPDPGAIAAGCAQEIQCLCEELL